MQQGYDGCVSMIQAVCTWVLGFPRFFEGMRLPDTFWTSTVDYATEPVHFTLRRETV